MKKQLLRRRTGCGLVLSSLLAGIAGCAEMNFDWNQQQEQASRPRSVTPVRYQQQAAPPTAPPSAKPAEATDDHRERHPSMWKRKLKATFT